MTKSNRLFAAFRPKNYNLNLNLQRRARKFSGTVVITGDMKHTNQPLKLHARDLTITHALIDDIPADTKVNGSDEIVVTPRSQPNDPSVTVTLEFHGKITDSMHGLYPCYFDDNGVKKELLMTQFEPFHAHEVFPCVDEPEAKATFDLTLCTENEVQVLSNMPTKSQQETKDVLITTFETSPVMSSYLLAFVVGELHKVSGKTRDGIEVNAWATPAQTPESLTFSLDVAIRSIEFFSDYFGTAYPLPKSDHVAVPDFSAGAMENWGLVTYREACLIVDESTSTSTKQHTATVIAHEVSHQWFGNLVTMRWWDDLWLNESFANMMEYVAIDTLFPQWKIWNEFASYESLAALRRDSLPGVQPVKLPVNHPDEIGTLFDPAIVYAKGGKLLNMLRHHIGDKAFSEGLKVYFKKHSFKNTSGNDLWQALAVSSKQDVSTFMSEWLEKSGFPVVNAELKDSLSLTQHHFLIGGTADKRQWPIPLAGGDDLPQLLEYRSATVSAHDRLILLNRDDVSYFVTHYDVVLEQKILNNLAELSDIDRLKLLSDANLLSRGLLKPAAELIDMLLAYKKETTQPVWSLISMTIADIRRFTDTNDSNEVQLKKLINTLCTPLYKKLGWHAAKKEAEQITKLRSTIIGLMIYAQDNHAVTTALQLYNQNKSTLAKLDGELRASIMIAAVRHSDDPGQVVQDLLALHNKTSSSELRSDICSALTSTQDSSVGEELLTLFTDTSTVRPQDLLTWFAHMIRNRHTRDLTWQWMTDNWDWIKSTFENDHHYAVFPRYAANAFASQKHEKNYKAFFSPKTDEVSLRRTIEIGMEEIAGRRKWIEKNQEAVTSSLAAL